jgi:hypothetical protein
MTRVVRSAPQYPARNPLVNHTTTKYFRSYSSTISVEVAIKLIIYMYLKYVVHSKL